MAKEFERIARLRALFRGAPSDVVALGIGDDAAILHVGSRPRVWTVDSAVEEVHFSRAFMSLEDIGYRAFMAAASDVAAMGGHAVCALSSLILPSDFDDASFDALAKGLSLAADLCHCPIVGGNLARGRELSLTTSVLGECNSTPSRRSGARVGDAVFVTGPVGAAALGLHALKASNGALPGFAAYTKRFLRPTARLDVADAIGGRARACIDISDGLVQDLLHLCESSQVAAKLDFAAIPLLDGTAQAAQLLGVDLHEVVLGGGEDYELLFVASAARVPRELATPIGVIEAGPPRVSVLDAHGQPLPLPAGFDHFRSA